MTADIYQTVTDSIVAMLERGVKPWAPQWSNGACGLPVMPTRVSGEAYRGINVALLWGAAEMKGYSHHTWMTFNQAKALGGCVRKGEKATPIVYWGTFKAQTDDTDEGDDGKARMFAKGYSVFNVEQIDGLPARFFEAAPVVSTAERIAKADAWAVASGADIRHGGSRAFFSPTSDHVQMPPFAAFHEPEAYYSTLAHELTHWTGHKARLDRQFGKRFGDKAYAFEELVAELGAAFACARLGIASEPREDHASYLASWLKVLKADKRAIFTAASKAQTACDHLFDLASQKPAQAPVRADGVICLPDLSKPVSAPEIDHIGDVTRPAETISRDDWRDFAIKTFTAENDDDDTPPPAGPTPMAGNFAGRVAAFARGRVSRFAARRVQARREASAPVAAPAPARPFHPRRDPSLCEYLSLKGICDDGGELQARDLDRWHREAPFRRKLVRADGVSLETAARQAWEAGYFPDIPAPTMDSADNMHPVTPEMLIAALDRELRDDYAHVWGEHDAAFFAEV